MYISDKMKEEKIPIRCMFRRKYMSAFSEQDLQMFLDHQLQLFPEPVAETLEEAEYC